MRPAAATAQLRFETLGPPWLDDLMQIERAAYSHPWSRGNFEDAMRAGYQGQVLLADHQLLGYFVAMKGVDEVHLLNITVAPEFQGRGLARTMLDALVTWSRGQGAQWLWLEVRQSNARAIAVYQVYGFRRVGMRKGYYPAADGKREDAVLMNLRL